MAGWWIQLELQLSDPEKNVEEFVFNFTNIVSILESNSWRIVGGLFYGDNKLWKPGNFTFSSTIWPLSLSDSVATIS